MTKKDYQLIAKALLEARRIAEATVEGTALYGVVLVQSELIRSLHGDNVNFDSDKFVRAASGEK